MHHTPPATNTTTYQILRLEPGQTLTFARDERGFQITFGTLVMRWNPNDPAPLHMILRSAFLAASHAVPSKGMHEETTFTIGEAVRYLRDGFRVGREGWNGKGMWIAMQVPDANSKMTEPYVYMRTAQGGMIPWLCSQADLLAQDWVLVPGT